VAGLLQLRAGCLVGTRSSAAQLCERNGDPFASATHAITRPASPLPFPALVLAATLVIALAAILALFLMADLHETVKKYVPWLDFTADQASERERASLNGDYQLVEHA